MTVTVFNTYDNHQTFAVHAQRFGLDIALSYCNAVRYMETSMASHLCVCIKTTKDQIWSYSTYPSKPILSCAATSLLHKGGNLEKAFHCLGDMINNGMVDTGLIGELVSCFLWLLMKDSFVHNKAAIKDNLNSKFEEVVLWDCQLISVVEFLKFVFGEEN